VKVFFDNCTSPVLAATLDGFISSAGHSARHIKDLPCGRNATDLEWIKMLESQRRVWMVVTGDDSIRKNKATRAAYRAADLSGFVLARAYQKTPMHRLHPSSCGDGLRWSSFSGWSAGQRFMSFR
jgi:PIN domain-containing protein